MIKVGIADIGHSDPPLKNSCRRSPDLENDTQVENEGDNDEVTAGKTPRKLEIVPKVRTDEMKKTAWLNEDQYDDLYTGKRRFRKDDQTSIVAENLRDCAPIFSERRGGAPSPPRDAAGGTGGVHDKNFEDRHLLIHKNLPEC